MLADLAGLETPLPDDRPSFERRGLGFTANGVWREADLYTPQADPQTAGESAVRAGLVLVPGAAETGRRDSRLVEFAGLLSRSGFAVLVPDIPSFRELRPSPDSVREIAAAVAELRDGGVLGDGQRLGIGAFSIASGPAVLAALAAGPDSTKAARYFLLLGVITICGVR
jgi:hypothetical protein